MRRVTFDILLGVAGLLIGCSESQPETPQRATTPAAIVPVAELQSVLESGAFADISDPSRGNATVVLPRIPNTIEGKYEDGHTAVFTFAGEERRVPSGSGKVSVLTDDKACVVVDEDQCGDPVRIIKIDREGDILFDFSEHHHAHSRVCFSRLHGLIFVYIFDLAEIRAYAWADCKLEFAISLPCSQPPLLILSDDHEYLYVEHSKEFGSTDDVVVRKFKITDLLHPVENLPVVDNPE